MVYYIGAGMEIQLEIPCKTYVKRYLELQYGANVVITRESKVGKYLFHLLGDTTDPQGRKYNPYNDIVVLTIRESIYVKAGSYMLSRSAVVELNNFIEEEVKKTMRLFVSASVAAVKMTGGKLMVARAIRQFAEEYGYTEFSFPYETMKKDYDRWYAIKRAEISRECKKK